MKQLGLSPYGIVQSPCRRMSKNPTPFPRGGVPYPFLAELYDGTNWAVLWTLIYTNGQQYNFYTDYIYTVDQSVALADAYQYVTPYQGLMGGELLNFYLKPLTFGWYLV
jgi:hypothetical protein